MGTIWWAKAAKAHPHHLQHIDLSRVVLVKPSKGLTVEKRGCSKEPKSGLSTWGISQTVCQRRMSIDDVIYIYIIFLHVCMYAYIYTLYIWLYTIIYNYMQLYIYVNFICNLFPTDLNVKNASSTQNACWCVGILGEPWHFTKETIGFINASGCKSSTLQFERVTVCYCDDDGKRFHQFLDSWWDVVPKFNKLMTSGAANQPSHFVPTMPAWQPTMKFSNTSICKNCLADAGFHSDYIGALSPYHSDSH